MSQLVVLVLVAILGVIVNKSVLNETIVKDEVTEGEVNEVQDSLRIADIMEGETEGDRDSAIKKEPRKKTGKKGKKGRGKVTGKGKGKGDEENQTRPMAHGHQGNYSRSVNNRGTYSTISGCPKKLPILQYGNELAGRKWMGWGNDIEEISCTGSYRDFYAEQKYTEYSGYTLVGSIVLNPGCSVILFRNNHFTGTYLKYTGPRVIPKLHIGGVVTQCNRGPCVGSMLWTCKQSYPSCRPSESWQTIAELDNSASYIPTTFTYEKTVGTTFSQSMTESMSISVEVYAEWEANFWLATAKMGASLSTGYDWTKTNSETKSKAHTFTVELTVPARKKIIIQEVMGFCGGSTIHTQLFRVYN